MTKRIQSYANRGMTFEAEIEGTNEYYAAENLGVIHKRPTPIQVVRIEKGRIVDAFFKKKSTVDFEGISRGIHLEFDCKECTIPTRFPLSYLEDHQVNHLKQVEEQGGIGFFLVKFISDEVVYFVTIGQVLYWKASGHKSIPRPWLEEYTRKVPRHGLRWHYLPLVWEEKEHRHKPKEQKGELEEGA